VFETALKSEQQMCTLLLKQFRSMYLKTETVTESKTRWWLRLRQLSCLC